MGGDDSVNQIRVLSRKLPTIAELEIMRGALNREASMAERKVGERVAMVVTTVATLRVKRRRCFGMEQVRYSWFGGNSASGFLSGIFRPDLDFRTWCR